MLLNEIINEVGMTKRAVKYYEEKGLLSVDKDNNGYRNYTAQDVETLKKISVYRKLGISIKDIQSLLETGDKSILLRIYQEKVQEKVLKDSELEALKQFIDDGDADKANEALDYQTVENAIEYSNAIVHAFQKFKAPFSGKIVHIFPEQSAVI
ncbi:MerR family transcriptional regulator [Mediterraneibacter gnavus]|uniref:MerR family transcriptional regulator n=1 Tax=Mediterraneibacter gnavus TaxID=33038 RepID=UPI0036D23985